VAKGACQLLLERGVYFECKDESGTCSIGCKKQAYITACNAVKTAAKNRYNESKRAGGTTAEQTAARGALHEAEQLVLAITAANLAATKAAKLKKGLTHIPSHISPHTHTLTHIRSHIYPHTYPHTYRCACAHSR
jgi:hypothetical protein